MDLRDTRVPTVLHVIDSLSGGGTERQLVALLRRFDHNRFRHAVVALRNAGELAGRLPDEVACRPLFARGRAPGTGLRLTGIARRMSARLIHARNTCTWFDATVARALSRNSRLVLGFHGLDHTGSFSSRQRRKARWAARFASCFTTVSHASCRQLASETGVPDDKIRVLENGVDLDLFRPRSVDEQAKARAALGLKPSDYVIGAVGSLHTVKRFDILIEAFAHLTGSIPHARAVILGDGPLGDALKQLAEQRRVRDRVLFAGQRDDVPECLGAFDVLVSCSDSEGMSNAVLEAMATALPVIASDIADHRPLLGGGDAGWLFERGSVKELSSTLQESSCGLLERNRRGRRARDKALEFDLKAAARRYEALYAECLTTGSDNGTVPPTRCVR